MRVELFEVEGMGPVLVVAGSLRQGRRSFRVAEYVHDKLARLTTDEIVLLDPRDFAAIPPFDQVTQTDLTRRLAETFAAASAFVFVVPEWHAGIPGHLKNMIDYLGADHFWGKPAAIITVSSASGGPNVASSLRDVLGVLGATLVAPFVYVRNIKTAWDEETGRLAEERIDAAIDMALRKLLQVRETTIGARA
jgi:NAD(P)H-dependent FMN reductase